MQKIASFIVKKCNFILVIVLVIAALCVFFIPLYPTARIRLADTLSLLECQFQKCFRQEG